MKTKKQLDQLISEGYSLDFSQTFDEILAYFKKTFLLNGLVILIFTLLLSFLVFFALSGTAVIESLSNPAEIETLMADKVFLLYYSLATIFLSMLFAPLAAGFIQLNRDIDTENEVSISNIFKHYQSKYFLNIVVFSVIIQVITLALSNIPVVGGIASLLIGWFTTLGVSLIIFANLSAFDALIYSFKLVAKNPFNILLILIVAFLLSIVGLIGLCIGVFFTLPIFYSTSYVLYKNIVGFDNDTKGEEVIIKIEEDFTETEN